MLRSWEKKEIISSLFDGLEKMIEAKIKMAHEMHYENAKEYQRILREEYEPARKQAEKDFDNLENNHMKEVRWHLKGMI